MVREAIGARGACSDLQTMPEIEIRNVPDDLLRRLEARAAEAGMPLSDYLLREIRRIAERPTLEEMRARLERLSKAEPMESAGESAADIIRERRGPLQ
jgi:plasmid stability protein